MLAMRKPCTQCCCCGCGWVHSTLFTVLTKSHAHQKSSVRPANTCSISELQSPPRPPHKRHKRQTHSTLLLLNFCCFCDVTRWPAEEPDLSASFLFPACVTVARPHHYNNSCRMANRVIAAGRSRRRATDAMTMTVE